MKSKVSYLILAIVFQLAVLIGMVAVAAAPMWTGTEVKIKTIPVDPRSLFRGNYARLQYAISEVKIPNKLNKKKIRNGEIIYALLQKDENNIYSLNNISLDKPETGVFLRGRVSQKRYYENLSRYRVKYGIEAYFAPKEKALALEKDLREEGIAVLMVSKSGKARLKEIISANNL